MLAHLQNTYAKAYIYIYLSGKLSITLYTQICNIDMAFSPKQPAIGFVLVFLSFFVWGAHPILRRLVKECDGAGFAFWQFVGEGVFMLFLLAFLGSMVSSNASNDKWVTTTSAFVDINNSASYSKVWSILAGGFLVGSGDFVLPITMQYIPASIAFPIVCGTCLFLGTLFNFFIVGNGKPAFLFIGLFASFFGVLFLAKGQSHDIHHNRNKTKTEQEKDDEFNDINTTATINTVDMVEGGGKPVNCKEDESVDMVGKKMEKQTISSFWVILILLLGVNNSTWSPLATLGQTGENAIVSPYAAFFFLIVGRIFAQFTSHAFYNLIIYRWNHKIDNMSLQETSTKLDYSFKSALEMSKYDRFLAILEGIFICIGYFAYFLSSIVLNKAAAFAITNSAPLFTLTLGVLFLRELDNYSKVAKQLVAMAVTFYVSGILFLTLSSV